MPISSGCAITRRCLADYHYRRALEMEENTEQNGAIDAYRKALDLDPTNAEYRSQLAWLYLRRARLALRQPSTDFLNLAEQSYEKAIQLSPQNGNYWLDLWMVYERLGKLKASALVVALRKRLAAILITPSTALS
jgi:Flp pilus assembly protein TadD